MSDKWWRSNTAGMRSTVVAYDGNTGSTEQLLTWFSSTCLVRVNRNRYRVPATYAGKVVSSRLCTHQVRIVAQSQLIAEHGRRFGRDQLICDPWHYLSVLEKKPGALRNGAPFQDWDLPKPIQVVRDRILKQPKGDRAFVELLLVSRDVGLEPLQVACELVLEGGVTLYLFGSGYWVVPHITRT